MVQMTTPGAAGWIEFTGPDRAAAQKFYSDVVGWSLDAMPMKDGGSYAAIRVEEEAIGGFSPTPATSGSWTAFITVTDVDDSVRRAKDLGARVLSEPQDAPGVGRMATLIDPQGARFALVTYESMRA